MANLERVGAAALLAVLGGCATISESNQQSLMVRAVHDNREVAGVNCVLTNDAGRWLVRAPGRITVRKSAGNLFIDCKKDGLYAGQDMVASKANSSALIGNAVTGGLGYLLDRRTGAGFDYPAALLVPLRRIGASGERDEAEPPVGNAVY